MTMSRRRVGLLLGLMVAQVARAAEASDGGTSSAPGVVAAPAAGASAADLPTSDGGSGGSLATTDAPDAGLVSAESTAGAPRRERADFRGQQDPPPTTGEVLIWVPRVILLPVYLVTEYVVRVPVGALSTTAEKNHWPTAAFDFFVFGPEHRGGIVPTPVSYRHLTLP